MYNINSQDSKPETENFMLPNQGMAIDEMNLNICDQSRILELIGVILI